MPPLTPPRHIIFILCFNNAAIPLFFSSHHQPPSKHCPTRAIASICICITIWAVVVMVHFLFLVIARHARRSTRQKAIKLSSKCPQSLTYCHRQMNPSLVSVRQAFLWVTLHKILIMIHIKIVVAVTVTVRACAVDADVSSPLFCSPEADFPSGSCPHLLPLLLGFNPHLTNTSNFRRRRLRVLKRTASFLPISSGCREHG